MYTYEKFVQTITLPANYRQRVTGDFKQEMAEHALKLDMLNNYISADIWMDIKDCGTYTEAKDILTALFVKNRVKLLHGIIC